MKRKIITTGDGSKTIQIEEWNEQYHSTHGAIQEAYHVFIQMGLEETRGNLDILEIGFGTGLNALITYKESTGRDRKIRYTGVEAFPVRKEEWEVLEYPQALGNEEDLLPIFQAMHKAPWGEWQDLNSKFSLFKLQEDFRNLKYQDDYDLIYFDAFGARVQPELWTEQVFRIMFAAMRPGGILVTYAAKGSVRRAMQAVGFEVERLPGPPGKREMLRSTKPA